MKKIIFVLFALLAAFSAHAQSGFIIHKSNGEADTIKNAMSNELRFSTWNDERSEAMGDVIVWLKSGEKITATTCKAYFIEVEKLKITCDENVVEISVADVEKFSFELKPEAGFGSVKADRAEITKSGNKIILSNLSPGSEVSILSIDGKTVRNSAVDSDGRIEFALENIPSGIYTISTNKSSFKVLIK